MPPPASACPHVLYACYGSNLLATRFLTYLLGGHLDATASFCASRLHDGARDASTPVASITALVPYRLRFARSSSRWHGKGVAFLDVSKQCSRPEDATVVRGWPLTAGQFIDVLRQENALSVHHRGRRKKSGTPADAEEEDPDNPVTLLQLRALLAKGPGNGVELSFHESPGGPLIEGSGWYSWLTYLADDPASGLPLLTFTSHPSFFEEAAAPLPHNSPSVQYGRVIFKGLLECGLKAEEAADYLNARAHPTGTSHALFALEELLGTEVHAAYDRSSDGSSTTTTVVIEGKGSAAVVVAAKASDDKGVEKSKIVVPVVRVGGLLKPGDASAASASASALDKAKKRCCPLCAAAGTSGTAAVVWPACT